MSSYQIFLAKVFSDLCNSDPLKLDPRGGYRASNGNDKPEKQPETTTTKPKDKSNGNDSGKEAKDSSNKDNKAVEKEADVRFTIFSIFSQYIQPSIEKIFIIRRSWA